MSLIAAAAAMAAGASLVGAQTAEAPVHPGPTPRSRPRSPYRERRASTYTPKVPTTPADFERIRRAELKRARKAAKRVRDAEGRQ